MEMTLSPMTMRDVPLFNAVRNASREWLHDQNAYTLPEAAAWFRRGGGAQFLVILLSKVPIGYCRVADVHGTAEKWVGMDIHPDYRGQGLARPAYTALLSYLERRGVHRFRLRVLKKNERARHIYESIGFEAVADLGDEVEMVLVRETLLPPATDADMHKEFRPRR